MPLGTRIALLLAAVVVSAMPWVVPAQSRATIKIATQSPLSGERAVDGEGIRQGAQLAIEQLKGPLERMGFRVELVSFDDQARPDVGVANARNIVADREILAVVGHLDGGVAIPSSEIYKEATLAMVSPAGTDTLLTDRNLPNVSRVCGRDDVQGVVAAGFAAGTLLVRSVYVLHDGTTAGQDVGELFRAEAERRGLNVLGFEALRGPADVDPLIASIKARPPDLVFFGGRHAQAAPFWKRAREQGVKARLLGSDGLDSPDFARIAGAAAVGAYYTSTVSPAAILPGAKPFLADFQGRFGRTPAAYAAEAYDATAIALKAIESVARGDPPGRDAVAAAIRKTKYQGVTGEIEFDGRGDRKKAPYFVRQIAGEDPDKWSQNRVVKQVTAGPPRT
jgi:branched-chain amino acid transport system substrate-binding protein